MAIFKGDKKVADVLPNINSTTEGKFLTNDGNEQKWAEISVPVTDVKSNGASIVSDGVANITASNLPNITLAKVTDVTATAAEVNVLDGITATTTELNYVDGVTSNIQTQINTESTARSTADSQLSNRLNTYNGTATNIDTWDATTGVPSTLPVGTVYNTGDCLKVTNTRHGFLHSIYLSWSTSYYANTSLVSDDCTPMTGEQFRLYVWNLPSHQIAGTGVWSGSEVTVIEATSNGFKINNNYSSTSQTYKSDTVTEVTNLRPDGTSYTTASITVETGCVDDNDEYYFDGSNWLLQPNLTNSLKKVDIVDNTISNSTVRPLSANQGKLLNDRISHLERIGRFLSLWDCTHGLPLSNPTTLPYVYKTGDYYRVSKTAKYKHTLAFTGGSWANGGTFYIYSNSQTSMVWNDILEYTRVNGAITSADLEGGHITLDGSWCYNIYYVSGTLVADYSTGRKGFNFSWSLTDTVTEVNNYRPNGTQYDGTASTTVETEPVQVNDVYFFDGTTWTLQLNHYEDFVSDVSVNGTTAPKSGGVVQLSINSATVGLGNVDNKSEATIKTDFTGSIASGDTGFVTGGDVYTVTSNIQTQLDTKAAISDLPNVVRL